MMLIVGGLHSIGWLWKKIWQM